MDAIKKVASEVGEFFGGLWNTVKALARGRKTTLGFVAAVVAAGQVILPQYADAFAKFGPSVDAILLVVIAAIAVEDGLKGGSGAG